MHIKKRIPVSNMVGGEELNSKLPSDLPRLMWHMCTHTYTHSHEHTDTDIHITHGYVHRQTDRQS